jgi:hypothetical protein
MERRFRRKESCSRTRHIEVRIILVEADLTLTICVHETIYVYSSSLMFVSVGYVVHSCWNLFSKGVSRSGLVLGLEEVLFIVGLDDLDDMFATMLLGHSTCLSDSIPSHNLTHSMSKSCLQSCPFLVHYPQIICSRMCSKSALKKGSLDCSEVVLRESRSGSERDLLIFPSSRMKHHLVQIHRPDLVHSLSNLVSIPSSNPSLIPSLTLALYSRVAALVLVILSPSPSSNPCPISGPFLVQISPLSLLFICPSSTG